MKLHNIKDYDSLVEYWRFEVKQALPVSRKVIYWTDGSKQHRTSSEDVLQYSGNSSDLSRGIY